MIRSLYNIFPVMILIMGFCPALCASTISKDLNKAAGFYKQDRYQEALSLYLKAREKNPESALIEYNLGTTFYKNGEFFRAVEHLRKALLNEDPALESTIRYNLGNALYKEGIQKEDRQLTEAIKALEESLWQYEKILKNSMSDPDVQFNHDFVKKELERLKKKQSEGKYNQDSSQEKKSDQNQNDPEKDQEQNQNQNQNQNSNQQQPDKNEDKNSQSSVKDRSDNNQDDKLNRDQENSKQQQDETSENKAKSNQMNSPDQKNNKEADRSDNKMESSSESDDLKNIMTENEVEMLLEDYKQNDEPRGMLYFVPHQNGELSPVKKDW